MSDLSYLRSFACDAQGCADYAGYGRHAPNCVQSEFDLALDEVDRLRDVLRQVAEYAEVRPSAITAALAREALDA